MKHFLALLLLTSTLAAQTIGQYEIRKRTATGFTAYGVTLSNGQVIGQTAGVPAAITPLISSDIGSTIQAYDADLTTYAGITPSANVQSLLGAANYAAMRTLLSLGSASLVNTTAGGNGAADEGLIPVFDSNGNLNTAQINITDGMTTGNFSVSGITLGGFLHSFIAGNGTLAHLDSNITGTAAGLSATLAVGSGGTGQTSAQAAINALMAASGALSQGDVFYYNGTNVVRLAAGTSGQFLKTNGAGANPVWADGGGGITIGTTTITSGTSGRVLYNNAGVVGELTTSGSGSVVLGTSPTITTAALSGTQTITKSSPSLSDPQLKLVGYGTNVACYDDDGTTLRWYVSLGRFFGRDFNDNDNTVSVGRDGGTDGGIALKKLAPIIFSSDSTWYGTEACRILSGTGSPEGVVSAGVGSLFLRQDGGASTTLYIKESGTGNTGWIAK